MFAELVELGRRVYKGHDALGMEKCNWEIVINEQGFFRGLIPCTKNVEAEKLSSKKGKARLLLDKPEETLLGYRMPNGVSNGSEKKDGNTSHNEKTEEEKKYERYIKKLEEYRFISELAPVFSFYNKPYEVKKAIDAFKDKKSGNMTFRLEGADIDLVSLHCVKDAIKKKYEEVLHTKNNGNNQLCAVCGSNNYPILDESHGAVKMPKGQSAGCMLVSYNENAFESYNLKGNLNSGICTNCARNYTEALKFLLGNGHEVHNSQGEKVFKYTNRQKISDDTIALFWTKEPDENIDPWSDICQPTEERIKKMFSSVVSGDYQRTETEVENYFYCCTLSSAAARIAVRDWMAVSVSQYQNNLRQWFEDIATIKNGETYYPGMKVILDNCLKKKAKPTQNDFKARARIGTMLWHAALTNTSLPLTILQSVLTQIEHEKRDGHEKRKYGCFSEDKSTVIRLVLNRYNKNRYKMKNELDNQNPSRAYLCGRLFALICKLQFKAQGAVNNSIKDRFFASASNTPARAMGLLLTKYVPVYEKKAKGAYSKAITEIASQIEHFPDKFSITERGEFALGYYYQCSAKSSEDSNNEQ